MTAQPVEQQQQPPPPQEVSEEVITAVMVALAVGAPVAVTAATLATVLAAWAVTKEILDELLDLMKHPRSYPVLPNPRRVAGLKTALDERRMRAWFLVNAARRTATKVRAARATGGVSGGREGISEALEAERRYWQQHLEAQRQRKRAADVVDAAVAVHGRVLGWYAKDDERVSPECKAANGSNFQVDRRPVIGWPGAVHPTCRCKPGPAFATSRTVDSTTARYARRGRVA